MAAGPSDWIEALEASTTTIPTTMRAAPAKIWVLLSRPVVGRSGKARKAAPGFRSRAIPDECSPKYDEDRRPHDRAKPQSDGVERYQQGVEDECEAQLLCGRRRMVGFDHRPVFAFIGCRQPPGEVADDSEAAGEHQ